MHFSERRKVHEASICNVKVQIELEPRERISRVVLLPKEDVSNKQDAIGTDFTKYGRRRIHACGQGKMGESKRAIPIKYPLG